MPRFEDDPQNLWNIVKSLDLQVRRQQVLIDALVMRSGLTTRVNATTGEIEVNDG